MSESPLAAYWRFFELFNTRDAYSFAAAMNYPHVRVSWARAPVVLADHEAHALTLSWDAFIKAGWDHTVGSEPQIIAASADKAHIQGGWTRYTAAGEPLLSNEVCYIATLVEGSWRIQSRFGIDAGQSGISEDDLSDAAAHRQIERFLTSLAGNQRELLSATMSDEIYCIGVGRVDRNKPHELSASLGMSTPSLQTVHTGQSSITVNAKDDGTEALIYAVQSNDQWRVKAGSWL